MRFWDAGLFPSTISGRIRKTMEQKVQNSHEMVGSLTQSYGGPPITRPIALVGLMGCGKSMVGRNLAAMFQMPFADSDTAIERAAGVTVADIFDLAGEAKFREMEYREIEILLGGAPAVIATGGGAFCQPDTAALLRDKALVVWLKAQPETLLSRIGNVDSRPLLHSKHSQKQSNETPIQILTRLNTIRTPFYEQAHLHVNTDGLSKRQAASKVMNAIADCLAITNTSKGA
jgi:shikimate kinase